MVQPSESLLSFSKLAQIIYRGSLTVVIETQAGRSIRGSSEAPDRNNTQDVARAIEALVVQRRTRVAEGV